MKHWLLAAAFAAGGALGGAALGGVPVLARLGEPVAVAVGGHERLAGEELAAFVERLAARVAEREAYLDVGDGFERTTFAALGIELDVARTLAAAEKAGRPRRLLAELARAVRPTPEVASIPLSFRFERERAREVLEPLGPHLHREPVNARLELARHRRIDDRPGRELDVSGTLEAIAAGERVNLAVFPVVFRVLQPEVTSAEIADVDVSRVLASYATDFSKKPRSRVPNIRVAASYLNGVVIGPGDTLSFNRSVGPRTAERGFSYAPVIVADELEPGLGGGVCQVASTLFAAAMLGGLEIVKRRSHSRPSGYAPLGLDAAVIYDDNIDLRLKNPYETPLIVHAFLPDEKTLKIELLGRQPPGKVEHFFSVAERQPFTRRVVVKPELAPGTIDQKQKGSQGYEGRSTLVIRAPDGSRLAKSYPSKYYPVPEVFWVAPDVSLAALPPLPPGATEALEPAPGDGVPDDGFGEP